VATPPLAPPLETPEPADDGARRSGEVVPNAATGRLAKARHHLLPILFLVAASAFVFKETLFFGYRFIGNSDRLNHYLSFILFHTHNLEQGHFAAWSEYVYDGLDTLSLPMSFVTPLFALPALLHTDDVVSVFGYVAVILLAITMVETYVVVYMLTHDRLASIVGACTYTGATYALLKLVQSDQTYLSVLTAPAFFYLITTTERRNWLRRFIALTVLVAIECNFAFMQEFSYNVIFFGVYSVYLLIRRNWYPIAVFASAMAAGIVLSIPRLWVQYAAGVLAQGRGRGEAVLQDRVDLRTLLRFFSRDIFGHSWRDQSNLSDQLNLHEGDLVHASVFGALLLVIIIGVCVWLFLSRRVGSRDPLGYYGLVFIPYILFVFAVMHVPEVYLLLARAYQNISFQHSRIGVSALLPIAILTGLFVAQNRGRLGRGTALLAALVSLVVILVSAIDFSSAPDLLQAKLGITLTKYVSCDNCLPHVQSGPLLGWDVLRFGALAALFVVLIVAGTLLGARGRSVMATVLAVAIVFQTVWGAADYVGGPQTRDYGFPYETNDFVTAQADQFLPPTPDELARMDALLDNSNYRSVTVCPDNLLHPDCNTQIGMIWGIRLMDGYASGVPERLTSLPKVDAGLHQIRFQNPKQLPWVTLSFLNVRQGIQMNRELYMNSGLQIPGGVNLVPNPSPYIYPRAYFASQTQAVDATADEATVKDELKSCTPVCDGLLHQRYPIDFVEGGDSGTYDASGEPSWAGGGDKLTFDFPASPRERFLVVNEMWDAGWQAFADGQQLSVKPVNVAMRGVVVPAGAAQVVMVYHSLLWWAWWYTAGVLAVLAIAVGLVWKLTTRRTSVG
jgi:hypothetical protein